MVIPLIVAHRSLTPGAVENARSAIRIAAASGADLIELDIRLTLDWQAVVLHDAFLRRTTRVRGWVRLWPSFLLSQIPIRGSAERERVTRLTSMLREFPEGIQPALHLKDRAALPASLRAITRYGQPDRTWLWLEHPKDVYTATRRLPGLRVTLLRPAGWTPANRQRYFEEAQWVGASGISVPWGLVDRSLLQHAHSHHLRVFSRLERMSDVASHAEIGLDGIITDDPQATLAQLRVLRTDGGCRPEAR